MSGFHGAFATGVASQQGTLTLPDTWFRPPFWDLLMLQLLRPNSSNLPCLYSTFHLEYPLVLSRFYFETTQIILGEKSCNLSSVFLMYFSKLDRNMVDFWLQRREKARAFQFLQAKRQEGGPSPIRTPTNLLKIDQNRQLYCNRQ